MEQTSSASSGQPSPSRPTYSFSVERRSLPSLEDSNNRSLLDKWSLGTVMRSLTLTVKRCQDDSSEPLLPNHGVNEATAHQLINDLFRSPEFLQAHEVLRTVDGSWGRLDAAADVLFTRIPATATNMSFFDRLYDCGALRANGSIVGCLPEYENGLEFTQELTKVLLMETSDHYDVFSDEERREFLFLLFQHLVYGGPLNQYEDSIGPYFDLTKALYKDLVSVRRSKETGKIEISSQVFRIDNVRDQQLFAQEFQHLQNFLYVIIHPGKDRLTTLYHAWCGD